MAVPSASGSSGHFEGARRAGTQQYRPKKTYAMQPTMNDWQRLDELLERGLDYYGRQLVAEAIQCWREVLYLSPGHRLALEYLEAAGASPEPGESGAEPAAAPPPSARPAVGRARTKDDRSSGRREERTRASTADEPLSLESLSTLTVELIRERKFEEALALLYTAHGEAPRDPSISRSISVVKQRLLKEYRTELGDPSQVPALAYDEALIEELPLTEDERELVPLIDGIVALEDVLQSCGLGVLQAHRALAQLCRRRVIVLGPPAARLEHPEHPEQKKSDALDRADRTPRASSPPVSEPRPAPTLKLVPPPTPEPSQVAKEAAVVAPMTAAPVAAPPPAPAGGAVHLPVGEVRSKTLPIGTLPPPPRAENRPAPPQPAVEQPRPSRYAAHVAEAVRAHLQGHDARAKELLQLCMQECPDEPTARRTLERLQQRLAAGNSDRKDQR